jgi:predicted CXXCH cytochrome family protein
LLLRKVLLILLIVSVMLLQEAASDGSAPRRIEVVVTQEFGEFTAPTGKSFIILYWEELDNTAVQSEYAVFESKVDKNGLSWLEHGYGSRVTSPVSGEEGYLGYYRYPGIVTIESAQTDYQNYTYHVGTNPDNSYSSARVYPPSENYHANYQKNTATCQGCHSTHYARHPMLLNERIMYNICIECHGDTGTFSKYNVLQGTVEISPGVKVPSPAGAFDSVETTSFHNVFLEDDFESSSMFLLHAPGSGGEKYNLTCTDCHSAHVTSHSSGYRLLKFRTTPVTAYSYVSDGKYNVYYVNGMNSFCSNCHSYYNYGDGSEHDFPEHVLRQEDGDGIKKSGEFYRHPTNIQVSNWFDSYTERNFTLPLESRDGGKYMTCKTCHYAHGTAIIGEQVSPELTAIGETKYGYTTDEFGNRIAEPKDTSSMLKRLDGMGICLQCHLSQIWSNTAYEMQN